jgi:pimeloyl-ACP methyl ester carboxylesterase
MAYDIDRDLLRQAPDSGLRSHLQRYGLAVAPGSKSGDTCLVFVHGLGGHVVDTWRGFPAQLAKDPDFDAVDIAFFGYKTTLFDGWGILRGLGSWLPVARRYDFEAKGRELADELRDVVRQRAPKQIVLAAHSLGGLVVIEAVRQLSLSGEPERRAITRHVSALVFYGTPFLGSDRVTRLSALASPDLRALSRRKRYRDGLSTWVARQLRGHLFLLGDTYARVGIFYSALDKWVDLQSARGRFPENLTEQWNVSHTALCKLDGDLRPYRFLKKFVATPSPAAASSAAEPSLTTYRVRTPDKQDLRDIKAIYEGDDRLPEIERIPWDVIVAALAKTEAAEAGPDSARVHLRYLLGARGRDSRIVAFGYAHHRRTDHYAWLAYLVAKRTRERAVGVRLALQLAAHLRERGSDLHGVFFEVESPNAAVTSNARDPGRLRRARIRLYSSVGGVYAITGLRYRQPRLSPDATQGEEPMHLLYAPVPSTTALEWLTRTEVDDILRWIVDVQREAFADHPRAAAYSTYLDGWRRALVRDLGDSVQVEPAKVLVERLSDRA